MPESKCHEIDEQTSAYITSLFLHSVPKDVVFLDIDGRKKKGSIIDRYVRVDNSGQCELLYSIIDHMYTYEIKQERILHTYTY